MINLIVWNCNGTSASKLSRLRTIAGQTKVNFIVLTESHNLLIFRMRGWKTLSTPNSRFAGIQVMFRNDLIVSEVSFDPNARFLICSILAKGATYRLGAIYAPTTTNQLRNRWWSDNIETLEKCDIVVGDFNYVEDPLRDRCEANYKRDPTDGLGIPLSKFLVGVWEKFTDAALHHNNLAWTFSDRSRLDRILFKPNVLKSSKYFLFHNHVADDHHILWCKLKPIQVHKVKTWRFKSHLIQSKEDEESLAKMIENQPMPDDGSWSSLKQELTKTLKTFEKSVFDQRRRYYFKAQSLLEKFPVKKVHQKTKMEH